MKYLVILFLLITFNISFNITNIFLFSLYFFNNKVRRTRNLNDDELEL